MAAFCCPEPGCQHALPNPVSGFQHPGHVRLHCQLEHNVDHKALARSTNTEIKSKCRMPTAISMPITKNFLTVQRKDFEKLSCFICLECKDVSTGKLSTAFVDDKQKADHKSRTGHELARLDVVVKSARDLLPADLHFLLPVVAHTVRLFNVAPYSHTVHVVQFGVCCWCCKILLNILSA